MKPIDVNQIKPYPGSIKGPNPEDDPEHWAQWYLANQPKVITELYDQKWSPFVTQQGQKEQKKIIDMEHSQQDLLKSYLTIPYPTQNKPHTQIITEALQSNNSSIFNVSSPQEDIEDLPIIPPNTPGGLIDLNKCLTKWYQFRIVPTLFRKIPIFNQKIRKLLAEPQNKWKPVQLPSVKNYYEMLPNYFKQHRYVQSVTQILDRKPEMSRKQKETFLNLVCLFLTPRDPKKYHFLQEYYAPKPWPQSEDEDILETEFQSVEVKYEVEKKENVQQEVLDMLGEASQKESEKVYLTGQIPDYKIDWFSRNHENPDGIIPSFVNYYDNDDGYWDEWIKIKRERNGLPEITSRPHFKH